MSEPSKEDLMAKIAQLEKQLGSKQSGKLEFRVGDKGGVERLRFRALSGHALL